MRSVNNLRWTPFFKHLSANFASFGSSLNKSTISLTTSWCSDSSMFVPKAVKASIIFLLLARAPRRGISLARAMLGQLSVAFGLHSRSWQIPAEIKQCRTPLD